MAADLLVEYGARLTLAFAAGLGRVDRIEQCFDAGGRLLPPAGHHIPPVNQFVAASGTAAHDELLEQALVYATINGEVAVTDALVQCGAEIDALPSGPGIRLTALHWAVAALLAHGAGQEITEHLAHQSKNRVSYRQSTGRKPSSSDGTEVYDPIR